MKSWAAWTRPACCAWVAYARYFACASASPCIADNALARVESASGELAGAAVCLEHPAIGTSNAAAHTAASNGFRTTHNYPS